MAPVIGMSTCTMVTMPETDVRQMVLLAPGMMRGVAMSTRRCGGHGATPQPAIFLA